MSDSKTETLLREMRGLITERLYNALTNPEKPPRASTIQAAIAWMRLTGHVEDPTERFKPRPDAVRATIGDLPLPFPDGDGDDCNRQKLADAVQRAVESLDDAEDDEGTDSEDF